MDPNKLKRYKLVLAKTKIELEQKTFGQLSEKNQQKVIADLKRIMKECGKDLSSRARQYLEFIEALPKRSEQTSQSVVQQTNQVETVQFVPKQRVKAIRRIGDDISIGTEGEVDSVLSGYLFVLFDGCSHRKHVEKDAVVPLVVHHMETITPSNDISTEEVLGQARVVHHYAVTGTTHPVLVDKDAPKGHNHLPIEKHSEGATVKTTNIQESETQHAQGIDLDEAVSASASEEFETNALQAGGGNGDGGGGDGADFLAKQSQQKAQKKRSPKSSSGNGVNTQRSAVTLDQLQTIMHMLVTGEYWSMNTVNHEHIIAQLKQSTSSTDPLMKDAATTLLRDIEQRIAVANTLQPTWQVQLHVPFGDKTAGAIGTVMSISNVKAHVRFVGDKKMTIISKHLLDPLEKDTEEQPDASIIHADDAVNQTDAVQLPAGETPQSENEALPPVVSDIVVDSAIIVEELHAESHSEDVDVAGAESKQPPFVPTDPMLVRDGSKALMVQPRQNEERFPIKDPMVFTNGFPFSFLEDSGVYTLLVVAHVQNRPVKKQVAMRCVRFGDSYGSGKPYEYEYPKPFSKPRYFYLTPSEWQLFSLQYPFGFLERRDLGQIQDMEQTYRTLLYAEVQSFLRFAIPGWTDDFDALDRMAQFIRAHMTDTQLVQCIVEGIGADISFENLVDLRFDQFLNYFDKNPLFVSVYEMANDVRKRTKYQLNLRKAKREIRDYGQIIEADTGISPDQLAQVAAIMQTVVERKENKQ